MENTEVMNNEVMETMDDVIYDVIPVATSNANSILTKVGIGAAVAAVATGMYFGGKKLYGMYKAKKDNKDTTESDTKDTDEE